jgi:hypothetical protein
MYQKESAPQSIQMNDVGSDSLNFLGNFCVPPLVTELSHHDQLTTSILSLVSGRRY